MTFIFCSLYAQDDLHGCFVVVTDGKHPGCDPSFIARREFSFTLEHDIYLRYLSFHDASEMEATIRSKCPHKIDIGAVYNVEVRVLAHCFVHVVIGKEFVLYHCSLYSWNFRCALNCTCFLMW